MDATAARELALNFSLAAPPAGFSENPYPVFAALREHSPVHALASDTLLLTRYAEVDAIYRSPDVSADKKREFAPKFGLGTPLYEHHTTSVVFNDPPLHTRVRRLMMGAVNQRAIARMEPGLIALVDQLLDRMTGLAAPDLIEDFAARIPVEVIGNLLDVPSQDRGPLREWSQAILSALEPLPSTAILTRGHEAVSEFSAYLKVLIAHRKAHPGNPDADVLTRLIQGETDGEKLTDTELLHNCIFLLNAGHETTTNLIGNGLHALITHRAELDRLNAEPALIGTCVEELLRFESPIQLNNRFTRVPMTLAGREIAAGTFITLAVGSANHDPAIFDKPDQLDITRKPNPHLAFGHGAHACSGMNVARLEGRIAIGRLLARFPHIDFSAPPRRDPRLRFRGFKALPVTLG